MKKRCSFYNLVEITLAMAVVAIGISGIMGLFVPAVDASREALAESNSSQSIATLLAYIERSKKADWGGASFTIPTAKPSSVKVEFDGVTPNLTSWTAIPNLPGVWTTGTPGSFGLTVGENGSLFCGVAQVWQEDISASGDLNRGSLTLAANEIIRINVRVSYPATVDDTPELRKERYYVLEFSKPE